MTAGMKVAKVEPGSVILRVWPGHDDPACPQCRGGGLVCEEHPWRAWGPEADGCRCGAMGMACSRGACGWCWNGVESVWPEGCPPHAPGQHIRDEPSGGGSDDAVLHEVVLDRDPSPDETARVRVLFEASSDVSLEATVAHFASVGIGVVWMRRLTRTDRFEPLRIMEHKAEEQAEVVRSAIQQSGRAVIRDEAAMRARTRRALDPFDLDDWL